MKAAISVRIRQLFDRYWMRVITGILFSILLHLLILSLQLGIPGLGLPGIGALWDDKHAHMPELSIRIANPVSSIAVDRDQQALGPLQNETQAKPLEALPSKEHALTELSDARIKQAPLRSIVKAPHSTKALKTSPAFAHSVRKHGSPPLEDQSPPIPAHSQEELIALTSSRPDTFTVPAPVHDEIWRTGPKEEEAPIQSQPTKPAPAPAIAMQSVKKTIEMAQEQIPALQKPSEQESFERPEEAKAKEPEPGKSAEISMETIERAQGEEIIEQKPSRKQEEKEAAQRAQDLLTRKLEELHKADEEAHLQTEKKREAEQATKRAEEEAETKHEEAERLTNAKQKAKELEIRQQTETTEHQQSVALAEKQAEIAQQEELKKQEREKNEQQAAELAVQKQMEEIARQKAAAIEQKKLAEEAARLKVAALEQQKQAQQLEAAQKAQESARQKAEVASQYENFHLANVKNITNASFAASGTNSSESAQGLTDSGKNKNNSSNQAIDKNGNSGGNLASKALEQIGKINLSPLSASLPAEAEQPSEDSRPHSVFGIYNHDVGVDAYIRSWRSKIERTTGSLNYAQSSTGKAREDPLVTVSVRSDGSVEKIVFIRSSGRSDLDEAVRRIVRLNAPYSSFPLTLAQKYSVIDIRRLWNFDETLKLLEEVH